MRAARTPHPAAVRPSIALIACAAPLALLAIAGCSGAPDDVEDRERGAGDPSAASGASGAEGADERGEESAADAPVEPASWPEDVEDLAAAAARFESVDACLAALRARTPTSVAEALDDVGYDALFDDVCRGMEAVHARDASLCDALSVSHARAGCRRRVAIVAGDPDACPEDAVLRGRDPICVAWASRDPTLCRAVSIAERASCEAVLGADASRCDRASRARCSAWIRRYAGALGSERRASEAARRDPELRLRATRVFPPSTSTGLPGAPSVEPGELDLSAQLARGVRLEAIPDRCAHRVVLDERGEPGSLSLARAGLRAELELPAGEEPPIERAIGPLGASLEIALPHGGRASGGEGAIVIERAVRARGGALEGRIAAELPMVPGTLRVEGTFRTFVRDLDALPSACAGDRMPPP